MTVDSSAGRLTIHIKRNDMYFSLEDFGPLGKVAFTNIAEMVFREDKDHTATPIGDGSHNFMPWGAGNDLPFRMIDRFEEDETLSACHDFLAEAMYAGGLRLEHRRNTDSPPYPLTDNEEAEVRSFGENNDLASYWLGIAHDMRLFEFAVSVLILSEDGTQVTDIQRKEAAYCRFSEASETGDIGYVHYAQWRQAVTDVSDVETIPLVDSRRRPLEALRRLAEGGARKVAVITRLPGKDSMYYPIPSYASIFKGRWYAIKRAIAIAKEAAIRNSTRIKYLIEIANGYWERHFREKHITDSDKKQEEMNRIKQEMIDFITGAENSGKALFATYMVSPDGSREIHDIRITKIESDKEGGDWSADFAEAVNMLCFAMRVHSNLVGSVPGKAQTNNSGSDKRELYMIAQALQKPCRDVAMRPIKIVADFNGWRNTSVVCPLLQLTTLDEHRDIKETTV